MKILIATHNQGKLNEIMECMHGLPFEWESLKTLQISEVSPETGSSYEENAVQKAKFYHELTGLPTIADDSGMVVDALKGELGVHTKTWGAGDKASDQEWLDYFMQKMHNQKNRNAKFVCSAVFVYGETKTIINAETLGFIEEKASKNIINGIPLSSVFRPVNANKVYSELSIDEKNQLSHRGKAFAKLGEELIKWHSNLINDKINSNG